MTLVDKGKKKFHQKAAGGKKKNGGGAIHPLKCFRCGELGHHVDECKSVGRKCFKYGKQGHRIAECKSNVLTCYNCGEPEHISTQFQKLRKAPASTQANGRVFALSGVDVSRSNNLI